MSSKRFIRPDSGDKIAKEISKENFKKSMKNKILKIWGLVMVVAILAGLLVPAAVPVSAANLSFTNTAGLPSGINGQFTQGTSLNQFVIAPDGKTAFAYSNASVISATAAVS